MAVGTRKHVVVVGLGMVGISFIEKLLKLDARTREYNITVVGEEKHVAYNRVGLTTFFEHRQVEKLYLNPLEWYESVSDGALNYHINTKVTQINPTSKTISCANGTELPYDILVLATGSDAVLPRSTPNHDATGVFVYRTVEDLEKLIAFSAERKDSVGAVVGGGLLGLEAAKALMDLQCYSSVKVVERNGWVLSRQLDAAAGGMVVDQVRELGVDVLLNTAVAEIQVDGERNVTGVVFKDGRSMECSTLCFAIGVQPRDELAREAGLECGPRGGIVVDDGLRTSDPDVYAIGECASWQGQMFGLIGPGVEMADVLAFNLTQAKLHQPRVYKQPDLSTKLKLLGVEVASFGDYFADVHGPKKLPARTAGKKAGDVSSVKALTYRDPFQNVYKKYIFTTDGKYLLGGMMIGDTKDYVKLVPLVKNQKPLDIPPSELILGAKKDGDDGADDLDDDTQICSCHNVTKGDMVRVIKDGSCKSLGDIKSCTKAGTGCGGCVPLMTSIFNHTMAALGNEVQNHLCPHFRHSRAELYHIISVKRLTTLSQVMRAAGVDPNSHGCEVCKPCLASIFASLWNEHVMSASQHGLQDTNDQFLGNIQRNGTYSVVPRMAAGEITPDKLLAIAQVAKDYNLYTKITGGQRIDMFGAKKQDLLAIWGRLVDAGMESGHAYAKALRTVKSCVGTTWCRYGVGDSVGMAVMLEERYKSIRAPHKIKGGVSGCVRECAEAQSKDFGLIATDKGFNIFVAGNGGANPRHASLLAKDVPPTEVIPILDRYLMFYIRTADKLQRTARWLEALPGGLDYLKRVVLDDALGINAALEAQMQELVGSYFDEWAEAINTPEIAARFRQFANTEETVEGMELERERGQMRPVMWPKDTPSSSSSASSTSVPSSPRSSSASLSPSSSTTSLSSISTSTLSKKTTDFAPLTKTWSTTSWQPLLPASYFAGADDLPNGISAAVKRGDTQLAVWRFRGRYYATQQMCPFKRAFVLADSLVGDVPLPASEESDPGSESDSKSEPGSGSGPESAGISDAKDSPYISSPQHKKSYSLLTGHCLNDPSLSIAIFEVEERPAPASASPDSEEGGNEGAMVYIKLPSVDELDEALGTKRWMVRKGEAGPGLFEEVDSRVGGGSGVGRKGRRVGSRSGVVGEGKEKGPGGGGLEW
ncbi:hypothetical protein B0J18DRAFT_482964 [Chaetomium sp. MPI-SDFR-AT-0129]|nr:hypothetical protein B0J18DRAFT_482964 [Chaetomium sp. MPI-SDFR-AT-0129]